MSTIKTKAYIPSAGEYDALKEKYPAFASADVSKKARKQDTWVSIDCEGKGDYPLRSASSDSSIKVGYGNDLGERLWALSDNDDAGLRVALPLIYNPQSSIVRGCRNLKRTTKVWNEKNKEDEKVTSEAPIVKYGKIDYIWTNKEECESGKSKVMNLVSLDLVERAMPFDSELKHNDFAKAKDIRLQCEVVAFENATEEEKAMAVEVSMSSEDNYEKLTYSHPLLENEEESEKE